MALRWAALSPRVVLIGVIAGLVVLGLIVAPYSTAFFAFGVVLLVAGVYLLWFVHPAWTLSGALATSMFAGDWGYLGLPGTVSPDRVLLISGVAAVVLKAPPVRDRPPLTFRPVHWAMVVTLLWFVGSAWAAGTLGDRAATFELAERVGLVPFLVFLVAPVVYAREEHRRILLGTLVAVGGYLGFTALMETLDIRELVFPSFINDGSIGTHADRARGPFLEAVTNGCGLFMGVVGAAIALALWREHRWRVTAAVVLVLCFAGLLFTETRSVWLGGAVATVVALLVTRDLRRYSVPAIAGGVGVIAVCIALIPGLAGAINERRDDDRTVWDRKNLATAAVNMVEAYPLVGIGWHRFTEESGGYFRVSRDFPLTAEDTVIHNVFLTYAAEAGLVGLALWVTTLCLGMGSALWPPARGEPHLWQAGLGAYLVFFLVISNFVFPQVFPNVALWLLAGAAVGAARGPDYGRGRPRLAAPG
jgi:putative inorganic carbon (HCO3(-)) transporter